MVSWDKGREEETGIQVRLGTLKKRAELSTNRKAWGVVGRQGLWVLKSVAESLLPST